VQQRIVLYLVLSLSLFLSSIYLDVIEYETRLVSRGSSAPPPASLSLSIGNSPFR